MNFPTLEWVLLNEKCAKKRERYLVACRMVLDSLYEKGIVWGDMAPRNILVEMDGDIIKFFLLDFEKTYFTEESVPLSARIEHARGPMCVEEFGAICSQEEVEKCFRGYFFPSLWDYESIEPVDLIRSKREVLDILSGRGIKHPSVGKYNSTEREIMGVRFPFLRLDGREEYPLHISFKIDHYFGAEYDRKTTEIFIFAHASGDLELVCDILRKFIEFYENWKFIIALEKAAQIEDLKVIEVHDSIEKELRSLINELYESRGDEEEFYVVLEKARVGFICGRTRLCYLSDMQQACAYITRATDAVRYVLDECLESCKDDLGESVIVLYGGGGRRELSFNSDLDIAVMTRCEEGGRAKSADLRRMLEKKAGVSVEVIPVFSFQELEEYVVENPEFFLELNAGQIVFGSEEMIKLYEGYVSSIIEKNRFPLSFWVEFIRSEGHGWKDIKLFMMMIEILRSKEYELGSERMSLIYNALLVARVNLKKGEKESKFFCQHEEIVERLSGMVEGIFYRGESYG